MKSPKLSKIAALFADLDAYTNSASDITVIVTATASRSYVYATVTITLQCGDMPYSSSYRVSTLNFAHCKGTQAAPGFRHSTLITVSAQLRTRKFTANSNIYAALREICDSIKSGFYEEVAENGDILTHYPTGYTFTEKAVA